MINGQRVSLSVNGTITVGQVLVGSDNWQSLMVASMSRSRSVEGGTSTRFPPAETDGDSRDFMHEAAVTVASMTRRRRDTARFKPSWVECRLRN